MTDSGQISLPRFWVSSGLEPYFRLSPHTYVTSWGARTRPSDLSLAHSLSSHCLAGFSPARSRTDAAEKSRLLPVCSVAERLAWRIYSLWESRDIPGPCASGLWRGLPVHRSSGLGSRVRWRSAQRDKLLGTSSGIWGGIFLVGPLVGQWLGTFGRAAGMQAICAVAAIALLSRVPESYAPSRSSTTPLDMDPVDALLLRESPSVS